MPPNMSRLSECQQQRSLKLLCATDGPCFPVRPKRAVPR
jgi:hypothetical protein